MLANNYLLPSLFTYHNPGRIYNADMLHSLPAVVMEMLIYSKPGEVELLPALADQLDKGSIQGVCCRNESVIDELSWDLNERRMELVITSRKDQVLNVRIRRKLQNAQVLTDATAEHLGPESSFVLHLQENVPTKRIIVWDPKP